MVPLTMFEIITEQNGFSFVLEHVAKTSADIADLFPTKLNYNR